jgi:two-component system, OmpR family, phosphate regulon response regulator PhoB
MNELIAIVEDETDLQQIVDFNLRAAGYRTLGATSGAKALEMIRRDVPDLVILDLMLPDISGVELCRTLRRDEATREVPVLMLTARGDEIDRVVGFEVGADDYMVKPFSVRELLLRVQAVLRRAQGGTGEQAPTTQVLRHGPISIDLASRRSYVAEEEVALTVIEFELLRTLLERRGRVQSRARLLTDVWQVSPDIESRTVDTHVKRLRQKLGLAGPLVETVRGVGYRLADGPELGTPPTGDAHAEAAEL